MGYGYMMYYLVNNGELLYGYIMLYILIEKWSQYIGS